MNGFNRGINASFSFGMAENLWQQKLDSNYPKHISGLQSEMIWRARSESATSALELVQEMDDFNTGVIGCLSHNEVRSDLAQIEDRLEVIRQTFGPVIERMDISSDNRITLTVSEEGVDFITKVLVQLPATLRAGLEFVSNDLDCAERSCKNLEGIRLNHESSEQNDTDFIDRMDDEPEDHLIKMPLAQLIREESLDFNPADFSHNMSNSIVCEQDVESTTNLIQDSVMNIVRTSKTIEAHIYPLLEMTEILSRFWLNACKTREDRPLAPVVQLSSRRPKSP